MPEAIRISAQDNVATCLGDLAGNQTVAYTTDGEVTRVFLLEDVRYGHKFATEDIPKGETIIKYGYPIGVAAVPIREGEHVHVHNVSGLRCGALERTGE